ncbi:MAG TPA: sigma-54 dependent transcriptional regulator [Thiobacillaceae bacterium]|nr:sigma-54 dependent transcriptional regulator [Thiobacillaceae bacterium]HNU63310.1 sigma-54 dependent transcriptional regulator [Thiobacillaceae bacterium]
MTFPPTVLIVDDEVRSLEALRRTLEEDFQVFTATGAAEARALMQRQAIHILLTDQRMPEVSGVEFLRQVRQDWPDTVRIIISGYTDSEDIIAGINEAGIYQYLLKPWHPEQLLLTLKRAAELYRLQQENCQLAVELRAAEPVLRKHVEVRRAQVKETFSLERIIRAPDSPMQTLCEQIARAARYDVSMLLMGESGTGKELLARAIHYASGRADQAFVVQNCGALPDNLLESELFGHRKGAYTGASEDRVGLFQLAHGGSLFLDEVGETSPAFQVKLLRVLQEGEFRPLGSNRAQSVDVRVIAATNRDLGDEVRAGRFREDLYYRLATVPMWVPPLRERPMDIPLLARAILEQAAQQLGCETRGFTRDLMDHLVSRPWPGNVRELQNEIRRMLVLSDAPLLGLDAIHASLNGPVRAIAPDDLRSRVEAVETDTLRQAMARHGGNLTRAAAQLGLTRLGLRNKLDRLGVPRPQPRRGRPRATEDGDA